MSKRGNLPDRIGNLPDSLIQHILSFMDTKYAVQTCILSKRWRYIWASMPELVFCGELHYPKTNAEFCKKRAQTTEHFVKFVSKVLNLRDVSNIQRFHLDCSSRYCASSDKLDRCIDRCITTAVCHNVQELYIKARITDENFEIPFWLCTCQSLTKLELDLGAGDDNEYNHITLPRKMSLPRLKSLHLRLAFISFTDEKLTNTFFSSFPTLETLVIVFDSREPCGFSNMRNIELHLPELKHFKFISTEEDGDGLEEGSNSKVTLPAPSLSSIIFDSYMSKSFTLNNLSSLVTADIEIHMYSIDQMGGRSSAICEEMKELYARRFMRFFRRLHKVKVLKLRRSFLRALGGSPGILETQPPEFYSLQHLELETYLSRDCLCSIFHVLKISPNIKSVSLQISQPCYYEYKPEVYPYCDEVKFDTENIGNYWDAGLSLSYMICHVKFVEIKGLLGRVNELKFLEVLLKHATVLEKVVLTSYSPEQDPQREKQMAKFNQMLLTFPTASKKIVILVKF